MPFSQKSIRSIIKKYYQGEISDETVIYIRDQLTKITKEIAKEGMKNYDAEVARQSGYEKL